MGWGCGVKLELLGAQVWGQGRRSEAYHLCDSLNDARHHRDSGGLEEGQEMESELVEPGGVVPDLEPHPLPQEEFRHRVRCPFPLTPTSLVFLSSSRSLLRLQST